MAEAERHFARIAQGREEGASLVPADASERHKLVGVVEEGIGGEERLENLAGVDLRGGEIRRARAAGCG